MPFENLPLDPERLRSAGGALGGGFIYAVFTVVTLMQSGQPLTRADWIKVLSNLVAAVVCGVVTAYAAGPALMAFIPVEAFREIVFVGFAVGAFGWEVWPYLYRFVRGRARREAEKQEGV